VPIPVIQLFEKQPKFVHLAAVQLCSNYAKP
jgi:hypothetical protein